MSSLQEGNHCQSTAKAHQRGSFWGCQEEVYPLSFGICVNTTWQRTSGIFTRPGLQKTHKTFLLRFSLLIEATSVILLLSSVTSIAQCGNVRNCTSTFRIQVHARTRYLSDWTNNCNMIIVFSDQKFTEDPDT